MDGSLPGSNMHGIFQARILEWVAISFREPQIKATSRYYFTSTRRLEAERQTSTSVDEGVEKLDASCLATGNVK